MIRFSPLAGIALCASALAAPAAPVPVHLMPKAELFYPTTVGARHVSVWSKKDLIEEVSKVEKVADGFAVELEEVAADGTRKHSETVLVTTRGLTRTHSEGKKVDPPCRMLVLPHGAANAWDTLWGSQKEALRTAGWEEIEVPAGTFRAMRVDLAGTSGIAHWYAPGIGCVNWYCTTSKVGRPLKSFTPGK